MQDYLQFSAFKKNARNFAADINSPFPAIPRFSFPQSSLSTCMLMSLRRTYKDGMRKGSRAWANETLGAASMQKQRNETDGQEMGDLHSRVRRSEPCGTYDATS